VGAAYVAGGLGVAFLGLGAYGWLTWRATRTALVVAPTTAGAVVFGSYLF